MGDKKVVLICDDEAPIRRAMRANLQVWGYAVIEATDGPEGLEQVRTEKPDLLVLDMRMPTMNGDQVCRELKGDESTKQLPIIMLTGVRDESGMDLEVDDDYLPADKFIGKPFELQALEDAVKELTGSDD